MITEFIKWCNDNEGFLSMVLSIITVIISLFIMWKSNKNTLKISEKQMELESKIAFRQEKIQQNQIKVYTYIHKIEYIKVLYDLKQAIELFYAVCDVGNLDKDNFDKLFQRYNKLNIQ
ncbi:hypothetical protein, partial [Faecalimonas sp.]